MRAETKSKYVCSYLVQLETNTYVQDFWDLKSLRYRWYVPKKQPMFSSILIFWKIIVVVSLKTQIQKSIFNSSQL